MSASLSSLSRYKQSLPQQLGRGDRTINIDIMRQYSTIYTISREIVGTVILFFLLLFTALSVLGAKTTFSVQQNSSTFGIRRSRQCHFPVINQSENQEGAGITTATAEETPILAVAVNPVIYD